MSTKIRDWTVHRIDDETVEIRKDDRAPLFMAHETGMDEEVLTEYIQTRVLEAELADAGATGLDVSPDGELVGEFGKATKILQETYLNHVLDSRLNQEMRQRRLSRKRG
jgi:hypothetical protein